MDDAGVGVSGCDDCGLVGCVEVVGECVERGAGVVEDRQSDVGPSFAGSEFVGSDEVKAGVGGASCESDVDAFAGGGVGGEHAAGAVGGALGCVGGDGVGGGESSVESGSDVAGEELVWGG